MSKREIHVRFLGKVNKCPRGRLKAPRKARLLRVGLMDIKQEAQAGLTDFCEYGLTNNEHQAPAELDSKIFLW